MQTHPESQCTTCQLVCKVSSARQLSSLHLYTRQEYVKQDLKCNPACNGCYSPAVHEVALKPGVAQVWQTAERYTALPAAAVHQAVVDHRQGQHDRCWTPYGAPELKLSLGDHGKDRSRQRDAQPYRSADTALKYAIETRKRDGTTTCPHTARTTTLPFSGFCASSLASRAACAGSVILIPSCKRCPFRHHFSLHR